MRISSSKQVISPHSIAIECHCVGLLCTGSLQIEFDATSKEDGASCWPTRIVCRQGFAPSELSRVLLEVKGKTIIDQAGETTNYVQKDKFNVELQASEFEQVDAEPSAEVPLRLTIEFKLTMEQEKLWTLSLPDFSDQTPLRALITVDHCRLVTWPGSELEGSPVSYSAKGNEFSFSIEEVKGKRAPVHK